MTRAGWCRRCPSAASGSQETFGRRQLEPEVIKRELLRMADRTASRMRKQRVLGRTVSISVRFADFTEVTRSATMPSPTDVTEEIYAEAVALYDRLGLDRARIRRVGVRMEQLVEVTRAYRQPRLTDPELGWREADQAVDAAVRKFGSARCSGRCWPGNGPAVHRVRAICSRETSGHLDWTHIRPTGRTACCTTPHRGGWSVSQMDPAPLHG